MTILAVIAAVDDTPHDKAAIIYGGLDMQPRFNTAINLAKYHKAPQHLITELKAIRKELQDGVSDRRNQAVHGAHADAGVIGAVNLTMVRWSGERRTQTVTLEDLIKLTQDISALQVRCLKVFEAIGQWKFPDHPDKHVTG